MSRQSIILIVDDNEAQRYTKTRTLQAAGFATIEAGTGHDAIRLAQAERPDLVLLDIKLPDIDGFEVCRRLRADPDLASIAIVQLTASYERPEYHVRGLEGGADNFLVAPLDPTVLVANVRAMIRMRRAESALRESDRRKDEFLAVLAHELRNPLAPLRNSLELFAHADLDNPVLRTARQIMERQVTQMVRLIDDLLDVSRINQNKLELRRRETTIAQVIDTAIETARPGIEGARHELTVRLPPEPVALFADPVRLAQVFANLLSNSVKYMAPGGRIFIDARREGGGLAVSVRDTGIGIDVQELPRVFEMFVQSNRDATTSEGGLGIGLALVRRLVEMHAGTVSAESAGRGAGSTFTVRLPIAGSPAALPESPGSAPTFAGGAHRRLLVVDDNVDSAVSLMMLLEGLGYEVMMAHDGEAAFELAEAFRPAVIFMDVAMPRVSGLDATARIRGQPWGKDIIICAITGFGQDEDRRRTREAGIDLHLVKPVQPEDLRSVLELPPAPSSR
jgi:two-component system, sensor histidine kinase